MHENSRTSPASVSHWWDFLVSRDGYAPLVHVAFLIFAAGTLWQSLVHAPWRDEAQAWLMARDLSVPGLFIEARHDGHPILWHLCLKALQTVGLGYVAMLVLNWIFICGATALLFYRSRLPLLARLAFAFCPACLIHVGYYARDYAISAFLFFLAVTVYRSLPKRAYLFTILIGLAANTNLYATAVFAGAGFQFLLEQGTGFGTQPFSLRPIYTRWLGPNLVFVFAAVLIVLQLTPVSSLFPPARPEILPAVTTSDVTATTSLSGLSLFLHRVENANILKPHPALWLFLLLFLSLLFFRKRGAPTRLYGAGVAWLIAMAPITMNPSLTRHLFVLFVGAIYFLWIYYDDFVLPKRFVAAGARGPLLFAGVVSLYVVALGLRCQQEMLYPGFVKRGDGPGAAQVIIDHHLDSPNTILVTTDPNRATAVLMLLHNIRTDYRPGPYPEEYGSFADFYYYRTHKHVPTVAEMKPDVLRLAQANPGKTIILVACDPQDQSLPAPLADYPLRQLYASTPPDDLTADVDVFEVYQLDPIR